MIDEKIKKPKTKEELREYNKLAKRRHDARKRGAKVEKQQKDDFTKVRLDAVVFKEELENRAHEARMERVRLAIGTLVCPPLPEDDWSECPFQEYIENVVNELEILAETHPGQLCWDFRSVYWPMWYTAAAKVEGASLLKVQVPELPEADPWLKLTRIGDKVVGIYMGYDALCSEIKYRNQNQ